MHSSKSNRSEWEWCRHELLTLIHDHFGSSARFPELTLCAHVLVADVLHKRGVQLLQNIVVCGRRPGKLSIRNVLEAFGDDYIEEHEARRSSMSSTCFMQSLMLASRQPMYSFKEEMG